jgi:hypothetical protein
LDRRLALEDRAAAQILGFIVGLAVVTASLAIATYFITTSPQDALDEDSQQVQGDVQRAVEILATTTGEPKDWGENFNGGDIHRVGLKAPNGSAYADRAKIDRLQTGDLTGRDVLESWGMNASERGIRIEGRVKSAPVGDSVDVETYGVAHASSGDRPIGYTMAQHSADAARLYANASPSYEYKPHDWTFGASNHHPSDGLGNTVPDHAWYIETQLIPMMNGIDATWAGGHGTTAEDAARNAFDDYTADSGNPKSATRWHVVANKSPAKIPGGLHNIDDPDIGTHAFTVNWIRDSPDPSQGVGHWHVQEGASALAMLGGFDIADADDANLTFDHHLKADHDESVICEDDSDTDCVRMRAGIAYWDDSDEKWKRLQQNATGCPESGWNDRINETNDVETGNWESSGPIDLCEAMDEAGDKVWLGLWWDTTCLDGASSETTCADESFAKDKAGHGWWVDNIELEADGETMFETDFEPPTTRSKQALFTSDGVDYNRTYHPPMEHQREHTVAYLQNMVEDGGDVIALSPDPRSSPGDSRTGEWLAQVGLSAVPPPADDDVNVLEEDNITMRYPNDLPEASENWQAAAVGWKPGQPDKPDGFGLPGNLQELTTIHQTDGITATLVHGTPYEGGGQVAAAAYNYDSFDDEELRENLYENLHAGATSIDPAFTVGEELPEAATSEVATDRRVVLVPVTEDDTYAVPLELTVWIWDRG